jgi:RNA-directed DNA polymerase
MMRIAFSHTYNNIISIENLLEAWREFLNGKRDRTDVQEFEQDLMNNIISLHRDLLNKNYRHSEYQSFNISDPKPRSIHKASVRDRLLHHAIYKVLYPFFDRTFISHSYSCRIGKGTHKAMTNFKKMAYKVSKNHTRTVWVLKGDIRKFFISIDHSILLKILDLHILDKDILELISRVLESFNSGRERVGLPLGNLTSQLFVNIYMNEFDQFMKHRIKARYYLRYADDFVILSDDRDWLLELTPKIADFLSKDLKLNLHPSKISIKTLASGVDFLGWVHFIDHRVLRTVTKKRMAKRLKKTQKKETIQSYLGLLSHGNTAKIRKEFFLEEMLPANYTRQEAK